MIPDEEVESALRLLAVTCEPLAKAVGRKVGFEESAAIKKAEAFVATAGTGLTVAEREAQAKCSESYREAMRTYVKACEEEQLLKAKRAHAEMVIKAWQTYKSSERAGVL